MAITHQTRKVNDYNNPHKYNNYVENYMKVSDVLTENREDCIVKTTSEIFNNEYEDIAGVVSMGFDEILGIMNDISAQRNEVRFPKEEDILRRMGEMEDGETVYVPKDVSQVLGTLEDTLAGENENAMQTIKAIQEFSRILGKHATTESEWQNSDDYASALQQAQEVCNQGDEFAQRGVKRSDF